LQMFGNVALAMVWLPLVTGVFGGWMATLDMATVAGYRLPVVSMTAAARRPFSELAHSIANGPVA